MIPTFTNFVFANFVRVDSGFDNLRGVVLAARPHRALEVLDGLDIAVRQVAERGAFYAAPAGQPFQFAESPSEAARTVTGNLLETVKEIYLVPAAIAFALRADGETIVRVVHEGAKVNVWQRRDTGALEDDAAVNRVYDCLYRAAA